MGQRKFRLDPFQSVLRKRQGSKKRRSNRERVNRRANIVKEARQGKLARPRATANGIARLQQQNTKTCSSQTNSRSQPVRPGSHNYRIV